jgi:hypothetical protein
VAEEGSLGEDLAEEAGERSEVLGRFSLRQGSLDLYSPLRAARPALGMTKFWIKGWVIAAHLAHRTRTTGHPLSRDGRARTSDAVREHGFVVPIPVALKASFRIILFL